MCQNKFECFLLEMHDKINNNFVRLTIILNLRLHAPVDTSSYSLTHWPFSDPHSTLLLFMDPLDDPIDPWGSKSTTLRTNELESTYSPSIKPRAVRCAWGARSKPLFWQLEL